MNAELPADLKTAAMMQLGSGVFNVFFGTCASYFAISLVCGVLTFFLGGLGGICGFVGLLLWPIGLFEIVAGGLTLFGDAKTGGKLMGFANYAELGSILAGGLVSAVIGFLVMGKLKQPDVVAYLTAG